MKRIISSLSFFLILILKISAQEGVTQIADNNQFSLNGGDIGLLANSVNLFTGDVAFPMSLISAPGENGIGINVSISYNSNIQNQANKINEESATGILGLGWSLDYPKILLDHKNTGVTDDDAYYLAEGGSNNEMFFTGTESYFSNDLNGTQTAEIFRTKTYNNWTIRYIRSLERWEITKDDGTVFVYGDKTNHSTAVQWGVKWGNWIGNSNVTAGQSQMAIVWNLSRTVNLLGDFANYYYLNDQNKIGGSSGKYQTEASYLSQITNRAGYSVDFNYLFKEGYEYFEPHIEKSTEPDAYQERYEQRYLSSLDLTKSNSWLKTVKINYYSMDKLSNNNSLKKRLIESLETTDKYGKFHEQLRFDYHVGNNYHGFLKEIITQSGASIQYDYLTKNIGDLDKTIVPPNGYASPKVWHGPDYTVVAWRQFDETTNEIDESDRPVKIYVYEWKGEWKEHFIADIEHVDMSTYGSHFYYTRFYVETQKNFFAIATPGEANDCELFIVERDVNNGNGGWTVQESNLAISSNDPFLISGDNFVGVGRVGTSEVRRYTRFATGWIWNTINSHANTSKSNHVGKSNYIWLSYIHNNDTRYRVLHYLNRYRVWTQNPADQDDLDDHSCSQAYPSSSYVLTRDFQGNVVIYNWNESYEISQTNLGSGFGWPSSYVKINSVNNSIISVSTNVWAENLTLGRFNGSVWKPYYESDVNKDAVIGFSLNNDFCLWSENENGWDGYRMEFNPNTNSWMSREKLAEHPDHTKDAQTVGSFWGNYSYYWPYIHKRGNNGVWNNTFYTSELTNTSGSSSYVYGSPNFFLHSKSGGSAGIYAYTLNNSSVKKQAIDNTSYSGFFENESAGLGSFITYSASPSVISKSIKIHKVIEDRVGGSLPDYPVKTITINDGYRSNSTYFDFNGTNATIDPSGSTVFYNKATVIPNSSSLSSKPQGWTETFFYNGDESITNEFLTSVSSKSDMVKGLTYKTQVFHTGGGYSSKHEMYHKFIKQAIFVNTNSNILEYATFILPTRTKTVIHGLENVEDYLYNNKNQLKTSITYNHDTNGNHDVHQKQYKYYWEEYGDADHLFSPIIQTKSIVNDDLKAESITTWSNVSIDGRTISMPYRTFKNVSNLSGYAFSDWNNNYDTHTSYEQTSEVLYNWKGHVVESVGIDGITSSSLRDHSKMLTTLSVANAHYNEILFDDFSRVSNSLFYNDNFTIHRGSYLSGILGIYRARFQAATAISSNFRCDFRMRLESGLGWASFKFNILDDLSLEINDGNTLRVYANGDIALYFGSNLKQTASYSGDLTQFHTYSVKRTNSEIKVYIDGDLVLVQNTVGAQTGSVHSLFTSNMKARYDHFRMYPADAYASSVSYDYKTLQPIESMDQNGLVTRTFYNNWGAPVATIDDQGVPISTTHGAASTKYNTTFNPADPSRVLSTSTDGEVGFADDFSLLNNHWFVNSTSSYSSWSLDNGSLKNVMIDGGSRTSDDHGYFIDLGNELVGKISFEFDLWVEENLARRIGFAAGNSSWDLSDYRYAISTTFTDNDFKRSVPDDRDVYMSSSLTMSEQTTRIKITVDTEKQSASYFVDGLLVDESSLPFIVTGIQKFGFTNYSSSGVEGTFHVDNFVMYKNGIESLALMDASGNLIQTVAKGAGDKVIIQEPIYDNLGMNIGSTRATEGNWFFGYNPNFVTGFNESNGLLSGDITGVIGNDSYSYTASKYEASPAARTTEVGGMGQSYSVYAPSSHTSSILYGRNSWSAFPDFYMGASYILGNYSAKRVMGTDGARSNSFYDKLGQLVMTKSHPVKISAEPADYNAFLHFDITPSNEEKTLVVSYRQKVSYSGSYGALLVGTSSGGHDILADGGQFISGNFWAEKGTTYYLTWQSSSGSADVEYREVNPNGETVPLVTKYEYDDAGNLIKIYPPNYFNTPVGEVAEDYVSTMEYDYLGRNIKTTTPDNGTTEAIYNKLGQVVFSRDANAIAGGYVYYSLYDFWGRVKESGHSTNVWSAIQATSNPSNPVWKVKSTFDGLGNLTKVAYNNDEDAAEESYETYTYDRYGSLLTVNQYVVDFNASAETISYTYDALGRMTSENYGNGVMVTYHYNKEDGSLMSIGDETSAVRYVSYTYDALGRMSNEKLNNETLTRSYSYDKSGKMIEISDPYFEEDLLYESDGYEGYGNYSGMISRATFTFKGTNWDIVKPSSYHYTYKYDLLGRLLVADYSEGTTNDLGVGEELTFDANGNLTKLKRHTTVHNYTYFTGTNRVQNMNGAVASNYTYDANGNITLSNKSTAEEVSTARDLLAYEGVSYKLNAGGSVTLKPGFQFKATSGNSFQISENPVSTDALTLAYDPYFNKTSSINRTLSGTWTTAFQYGAGGERVLKYDHISDLSLWTKTRYVFGVNDFPIKTITKSHNSTDKVTYYVYGPTGLIATKEGSKTHFVLKDHQGSTRLVVDNTNLVVAAYNYRPFGGMIDNNASEPLSYKYTGHEYDEETGLHNFRARLYDEDLGRFYGYDPAEQFPSPYTGLANNYINATDPTGEAVPLIGAIVIAAYISAASYAGYTAYQAATGPGSFSDYWYAGDFTRTVFTGAVSGAVSWGVGSFFGSPFTGVGGRTGLSGVSLEASRAVAHGVTQGGISQLSRGDFKSGFIGGSVGSLVGSGLDGFTPIFQVSGSVIAGGVVSKLAGGSFMQGAISAGFSTGFNHLMHSFTNPYERIKVKPGQSLDEVLNRYREIGLSEAAIRDIELTIVSMNGLDGSIETSFILNGGDLLVHRIDAAYYMYGKGPGTADTIQQLKDVETPWRKFNRYIDHGMDRTYPDAGTNPHAPKPKSFYDKER